MSRAVFLFLLALGQFGQSNTGELRLTVTDPAGLPLPGTVEIVSDANRLQRSFDTDSRGVLVAKRLAFGTYHVAVVRPGFAGFSRPRRDPIGAARSTIQWC